MEEEDVVVVMATNVWRITHFACGFHTLEQGFIATKDTITNNNFTFGQNAKQYSGEGKPFQTHKKKLFHSYKWKFRFTTTWLLPSPRAVFGNSLWCSSTTLRVAVCPNSQAASSKGRIFCHFQHNLTACTFQCLERQFTGWVLCCASSPIDSMKSWRIWTGWIWLWTPHAVESRQKWCDASEKAALRGPSLWSWTKPVCEAALPSH